MDRPDDYDWRKRGPKPWPGPRPGPKPRPSSAHLRRAGFYLVREGPTVELWAKLRREGGVVLFSAVMRGARGEPGNVPSTVWKLSVVKRFNPRQRRELLAMARSGL